MVKKAFILLFIIFSIGPGFSQTFEEMDDNRQGITVWFSSDTIVQGDYLELKFTIHNLNGKFEAPSFEDYEILSGPNLSRSMSIINGDRKSTEAYSYVLSPLNSGISKIESFVYESKDNAIIIDEIITVSLDKKADDIRKKKNNTGITIFYSAETNSAPVKKKKTTQFKKRKV